MEENRNEVLNESTNRCNFGGIGNSTPLSASIAKRMNEGENALGTGNGRSSRNLNEVVDNMLAMPEQITAIPGACPARYPFDMGPGKS